MLHIIFGEKLNDENMKIKKSLYKYYYYRYYIMSSAV